MFKEQMNKVKSIILKKQNNVDGMTNDKKKIENLVAFLIILIITLIVINSILKKDGTKKNNTSESPYKELAKENVVDKSSSNELEKRLETILTTIFGVRQSKCFSYIFKI